MKEARFSNQKGNGLAGLGMMVLDASGDLLALRLHRSKRHRHETDGVY
jgi:hypothetical protein